MQHFNSFEGLLHYFQWSFTRDASELDCQENCQSEAYQHDKHEIQTQAYKLLETLQVPNQYIFKSGKDTSYNTTCSI